MGNAHVWGPELVQPLEALGWVTVYAQAEATRARTTATVRMVEVVEEREKKEGKKKERRWVPTEEDWAGEVLVGKMQTSFLSGVEIPRGYAIFTSYLVTGKFSPPCSSFLASITSFFWLSLSFHEFFIRLLYSAQELHNPKRASKICLATHPTIARAPYSVRESHT